MFGALICAIALLGTILGGYALNVDSTTTQETDYKYVTDVSGLFQYTDTPQYVNYNSSKNFTGYTLSNGSAVSGDDANPTNNVYTKTSQPNSYLMEVASTDTTTTVNLHVAPYDSPGNQSTPRYSNSAIYYGQFIDNAQTYQWIGYNPYILTIEKFYSLYASNVGANTTSIDFIFNAGQVPPSAPTAPAGLTQMNPSTTDWAHNYLNKTYHDYNSNGTLTYNVGTGAWTFNGSTINPADYYIVFSADLKKYLINGSTATETGQSASYAVINISVTQHQTSYNYMDVSKGVRNANTTAGVTMDWANGYTNGQIDILYNLASGQNDTITFGTDTITLSHTSGRYHVNVNGTDNDIGAWHYAIIQIDAVNGTVRAVPVYSSDFRTFTNYTPSAYSYDCGTISATSITALHWTTTHSATAPLFSVVNTSVYMDTHGAVMLNPSLNITSYFTDLTQGYRLNLYSFALYGSSITINNVTYAVTNGKITINNEPNALNNLFIQTAGGHTYIQFVDTNARYDLGVTVSDTLSMAGNWFYTTGFYEGYQKTVKAYSWDWHEYGFSTAQLLIVYMGLVVAGLFVGKAVFGIKPSYIDYIIAVGAVAVVFGLCEVLL